MAHRELTEEERAVMKAAWDSFCIDGQDSSTHRGWFEAGYLAHLRRVVPVSSEPQTVWTCMSCGHIAVGQSCEACGGEARPGEWIRAEAARPVVEAAKVYDCCFNNATYAEPCDRCDGSCGRPVVEASRAATHQDPAEDKILEIWQSVPPARRRSSWLAFRAGLFAGRAENTVEFSEDEQEAMEAAAEQARNMGNACRTSFAEGWQARAAWASSRVPDEAQTGEKSGG